MAEKTLNEERDWKNSNGDNEDTVYGHWQVMSGMVCEDLLVYVLKETELAFQDVVLQATQYN